MALLSIERIVFFDEVSIFRSLTIEDLSLIVAASQEEAFSPKDIIFREGDAGEKFYIVVKGSVSLIKKVDNEDLILERKGPRSFFGEMALFSENVARSATARCDEHSVLLTLEKSRLIELVYSYPRLALDIISGITHMLRHSHKLLAAYRRGEGEVEQNTYQKTGNPQTSSSETEGTDAVEPVHKRKEKRKWWRSASPCLSGILYLF